jgi:2-polyprenyl-3-methyl-5-hydroxy-6-metoxy-1,4-benzoquinol methylase
MNNIDAERVHGREIASGERFQFGANWRSFLDTIDDDRIAEAERSLLSMLGHESLSGLRFLDIGCGSGLFSLAATRLGASVHSFDFDPMSVACAEELRDRFGNTGRRWTIDEGSVLDTDYLGNLGAFDVVYAWGALHHTGNMALALSNSVLPLATKGQLFVAIYNDQGWKSRVWWRVKKAYCSGILGRAIVLCMWVPVFAVAAVISGVMRDGRPWSTFRGFKSRRGMSIYHDWVDWLGGFPFEYATVDSIKTRYEAHGLILETLTSTKRWGCNEFVFRRPGSTQTRVSLG